MAGVLCYDATCPFCTNWVRRLLPLLRRWNVRPRALQADDIARRLGLAAGEVGDECRFIGADGQVTGGGDVVAELVAAAGWRRGAAVLRLRPIRLLLRRGYRVVAARWHCDARGCQLQPRWWRTQTIAELVFGGQGEHRRHGFW